MIRLGHTTGGRTIPLTRKEKIRMLFETDKSAIEVSFISLDYLNDDLDAEEIEMIKQFGYISIHATVLLEINDETGKKTKVRYPGKEAGPIAEKLLEIAKTINADTVLFHPDIVDDFAWLDGKFGDLLAFENMDSTTDFGRTVEDMRKVFRQAPHAKFVLDINHIYTNDPTMKLAEDFHRAFGGRLCHYHISAYNGFHDAFYRSNEDIILSGIKNLSLPLIDEGKALLNGKESLLQENEYVIKRLGG